MTRNSQQLQLTRRGLLKSSTAVGAAAFGSSWLASQIQAAMQNTSAKTPRKCILLWMSGGPSQMETFDPKPDHENGGPTKAIATSVPGLSISENLPGIAKQMGDLAILRSMTTKEGDHSRATYLMHTGYLPQGPIRYPTLGSLLSQRLVDAKADLPAYFSINPFQAFNPAAYGSGFLGPSWSPLVVESNQPNPDAEDAEIKFQVQNLRPPESVAKKRMASRLDLLKASELEFLNARPGTPGESHVEAYQKAVRMMNSTATKAFDLSQEDDALRDAYGRNGFGQGCLLARRLIEHGVSFVEVTLSSADGNGTGAGWDTHAENFDQVGQLCGVLDPAWSTLMSDLKQRGLLDDTLIVWMGEFGRTPQINDNSGRDHWPNSWSTVLGGAGVLGGQAVGKTSDDGVAIEDRPVTVPALIATICEALQLDPASTNPSNVGRPIPLADHDAESIDELLRNQA